MVQQVEEQKVKSKPKSSTSKLSDVAIGILVGLDAAGVALVVFSESASAVGVPARATVPLSADDVGCEVALLFENGDCARPLIIGRVQTPRPMPRKEPESLSVQLDGESITLSAEKDIVLKCGKASITLTRAGKVLIRGTYLLSRSSGANRIKGGSVQLN